MRCKLVMWVRGAHGWLSSANARSDVAIRRCRGRRVVDRMEGRVDRLVTRERVRGVRAVIGRGFVVPGKVAA